MKFLSALILASVVIATPAMAQHRHGGHHHHHHHHHHYRANPAPYIAGALGLAILGGIVYDQYNRRCYSQVIGYDSNGDPVVRKICE